MRQTEFTQEEWDAFNIADLRMDDFVKSGLFYFKPAVAGAFSASSATGNGARKAASQAFSPGGLLKGDLVFGNEGRHQNGETRYLE